jgi:hypothetical protein
MTTSRKTRGDACRSGHALRRHQTRAEQRNARAPSLHVLPPQTTLPSERTASPPSQTVTPPRKLPDAATAEPSAVITADSAAAGAAGSHAATSGHAYDKAAPKSTADPNSYHSATNVAATTAEDHVNALATTLEAVASDKSSFIELRQRIYHSGTDRDETPIAKSRGVARQQCRARTPAGGRFNCGVSGARLLEILVANPRTHHAIISSGTSDGKRCGRLRLIGKYKELYSDY